jgi:hypothetical protein
MSSLGLVKKINVVALGLLFLIVFIGLHVLTVSNLNILEKLLVFSMSLSLYFLLCTFEYLRIKFDEEEVKMYG